MKFRIPCEWRLKTIEEIEAPDLLKAQDKAAMLTRPATLDGAEIETIIGVVDFQRCHEMYPIPKPPDPMEGWKCEVEPGPYEGGLWTKKVSGCKVSVIGDSGPIDVGFTFPTYGWRIEASWLPADMTSKGSYREIEDARDDALKMARKFGRNNSVLHNQQEEG